MSRPKEKLFVLAGNWAYSNRGCEAIVRGTTALFREEVGECLFVSNYFTEGQCSDAQRETDPTIIHRPFPSLKRYSLPWVNAQIARKLFHRPVSGGVSQTLRRSLKDAHAVLMLGGDNFSLDYGGADIYFGLSSIAVARNLPVAIWGASIGPFADDPDYERWAAEKLRRISLLCVRETETLAYLASIGLGENVILSADPSFYLEPSACELPVDIEMALTEGCIGLNLSPLLHRYMHRDELSRFRQRSPLYRYMHRGEFFRFWQKSLRSWTQVAAEVVRSLLSRFSQPLLLIPHVMSETGDIDRDDYLFLRRVAQLVQEPQRVFVLGANLNAAQTKWVISRVRVFAGARTHATLAAISSGVPTVCIGYSMKARGIAKDVYGHLDWLVKDQDLTTAPSVLCDRLVSLFDQEPAIRSHLERMNPLFRQRAKEAVKRFLDIIEFHYRPLGHS